MDLSLRPPTFPVTLEKWYVDALLDDGTVLLVYLARLSLFGVRVARVTAELFRPDGTSERGDAKASGVAGEEGALRFGPASIEGDRLRFETPGLAGDLVYRPRHAPSKLRDPFLVEGARSLTWSVEIPDADVEGTLRWPGGERTIAARGYRDRVAFDLLPWRFPIRELVWGRAVAPGRAATWVRATTRDGAVEAAWLDGQPVAGAPPAAVAIGAPRVLVDADVLALEGLRLGALRSLLERMSGNPHETKYAAPCTIDGAPGVAVHEIVRWPAVS